MHPKSCGVGGGRREASGIIAIGVVVVSCTEVTALLAIVDVVAVVVVVRPSFLSCMSVILQIKAKPTTIVQSPTRTPACNNKDTHPLSWATC